MIFDKLKAVMKKSGVLCILRDADGYQWIGTPQCLCLAADLPDMNEETLKAVLSIGEKKRTEYTVQGTDKLMSEEALIGWKGEETALTEYAAEIRFGSTVFRAFRTDKPSDGLILIDKKHLEPFADTDGGTTLYLRGKDVTVKRGIMVVGLIAPFTMGEMIGEELSEIASLAEISMEKEREAAVKEAEELRI